MKSLLSKTPLLLLIVCLFGGCVEPIPVNSVSSWRDQVFAEMQSSFDRLQANGIVKFNPYGNRIVIANPAAMRSEYENLRTKARMHATANGLALDNMNLNRFDLFADKNDGAYNKFSISIHNLCIQLNVSEDDVFGQIAKQGFAFVETGVPERAKSGDGYIVPARWIVLFPIDNPSGKTSDSLGLFAFPVLINETVAQPVAAPPQPEATKAPEATPPPETTPPPEVPAPQPVVIPPPAPGSLEQKLTDLKSAFDKGLLSQEEYDAARAKILGNL